MVDYDGFCADCQSCDGQCWDCKDYACDNHPNTPKKKWLLYQYVGNGEFPITRDVAVVEADSYLEAMDIFKTEYKEDYQAYNCNKTAKEVE